MNKTLQTAISLFMIVAIAVAFYVLPAADLPVTHRYAPDDVYYLREYLSFDTPHGTMGLVPGQEVRLNMRAVPVRGKVIVTDGTNMLALNPEQMTHDIDEAIALRANDELGGFVIGARIAQPGPTAAEGAAAIYYPTVAASPGQAPAKR